MTLRARLPLPLLLLALAPLATAGCRAVAPDVHAAAPTEIHVETVAASARRAPTTFPVTGTVEADLQTTLAANAAGKVLVVRVKVGDVVKKGDVVAELDTRASGLQAATAKAQADVSGTQASMAADECARAETLAKAGALSGVDLDRARWNCKVSAKVVDVAQLSAQLASVNAAEGTIRAPFGGVVIERLVQPGEYVMPSSRVASIVATDALALKITVPEAQIAQLRVGVVIPFQVRAFPGRTFTATLARVSPVVRPQTRDLVAEAEVSDPDHALRAGMFASAELPLGEAEVVVAPKSAIVARDGVAHVFVVRDGRVEERSVLTGASLGDDVAVLRGLAKGDAIVKAPAAELKNGAFVKAS